MKSKAKRKCNTARRAIGPSQRFRQYEFEIAIYPLEKGIDSDFYFVVYQSSHKSNTNLKQMTTDKEPVGWYVQYN